MATQKVIPGPYELPLIGSTHTLLLDPIKLRTKLSRLYPNINRAHLGPYTLVRTNNAQFIHDVLTTQIDEFDKTERVTGLAKPVLGNGLLTIPNQPHRRTRRLVQPAFNHSRVVNYAAAITRLTAEAQASWQDGQVVNVAEEMMKLTMRIISTVMFSTDVTAQSRALGDAVVTAMAYVTTYFFFPIVAHLPLPPTLRYRRAVATLNKTIFSMIRERRASGEDKGDLLSMLIQTRDADGEGLSDEEIRDEVMTIFIAGHETTANALTWTFYLLAQHPAIYSKLEDEIERVLDGRLPTSSDTPSLSYTEQVVKEALRLYPPAHFTARIALTDTHIGEYPIRKGTLTLLDIYTMHHRADYFPAPEQFDPDRFSEEREKDIPKWAYLPFGAGPRVCIGNSFAMMEATLALATVVQKVHFELVGRSPVKTEALVSLRPKGGIEMRVRRR